MSTPLTYPGVYIQELPSPVHAITGVATSIAAFVGYTATGIDNRAQAIFSFADFQRLYGGLASNSELSYAVQQFYINAPGAQAYVVRTPMVGATQANVKFDGLTFTALSSGAWANGQLLIDVDTQNIDLTADSLAFNLTITDLAANTTEVFSGVTLNSSSVNYLTTRVNDPDTGSQLVNVSVTGTPTTAPAVTGITGQAINITGNTSVDAAVGGGSSATLASQDFALQLNTSEPSPLSPLPISITVFGHNTPIPQSYGGLASQLQQAINSVLTLKMPGASVQCSVTTLSNGQAIRVNALLPNHPDAVLTFTAPAAAPSGLAVTGSASGGTLAANTYFWKVTAITAAGETGASNEVSAALTGTSSSAALSWTQVAGATGYNVYRGTSAGNETTQLANVTTTASGTTLKFTDTGAAGTSTAPPPAPPGDAAGALGLSSPTANVAHYALGTTVVTASQTASGAGSDGTGLPGNTQLIGNQVAFTGIYALQKVDQFNLLCIPDATRAMKSNSAATDNGLDPSSLYQTAIALCQAQGAFLLVDPPPQITTVTAALDWKSSLLGIGGDAATYGAAFWPRLRATDPLNNNNIRTFAPSGVVAGVYAATDGSRGVWKAPAGTQAALLGVHGLQYALSDAENGLLNPLGLNCFRTFPVYSSVLWGARTLAGADAETSQWKYVPVRRMALFLEQSLYRGLQWVVFEPNDEPLWASIRLNVNSFMQTYFLKQAFQGQTPGEAYFVKCDSDTTTQADIDAGVVNILVGFAPLKPAEFVVIQIQQLTSQAQ